MIEPGIDEPIVLRRVLESIEGRLVSMSAPIDHVTELSKGEDIEGKLAEIIVIESKLNELINTVNVLSTLLNDTRKNPY